jgi:hypothetical protein
MKRAFVILVLLLGAWTYVPVRERTYIPLYDRLSPLLHKLIEPSQEGAARQKARQLLRILVIENNQGRPLPEPRDFARWVNRRLNASDAATDPWGSTYYYYRRDGRITVGSPGPDRRIGTDDDIIVSAQP